MAAVTFTNITKRYKDGPKAVDDLNLEIAHTCAQASNCFGRLLFRVVCGLLEHLDRLHVTGDDFSSFSSKLSGFR